MNQRVENEIGKVSEMTDDYVLGSHKQMYLLFLFFLL